MSLLVVMAHFDAERVLRRHTLRSIENYANAADRMVLVSTSGLKEEYLDELPSNVEYILRDNYGYDFYSYKWGLDSVGNYDEYDRVLVVNDSFVGPFVPVKEILEHENCSSADFSGLTLSERHGAHVQSFFFTFTSAVSKSKAFRRFWDDMIPVSERLKVISEYEVGLTAAVRSAGFKVAPYFIPSADESILARNRWEWHLRHRISLKHPDKTVIEVSPASVDLRNWNPAVAFADRVMDDFRMPVLKFDAIRFDPYALGIDHLISECERVMPGQFEGVRQFVVDTRHAYPFRPGETNIPVSDQHLRAAKIGYLYDQVLSEKLSMISNHVSAGE